MNPDLGQLLGLVRLTLRAPREAAAVILRYGFAPVVGWMALLLMAVVSTILTHFSVAAMPADAREFWGSAMRSPISTAILQWAMLLVLVQAVHKIGRLRGGHGSLQDSVVLVAWLQFIMLGVQVLQLVLQVLVPPLAELVGLVGIGLFFWLLTQFLVVLHGFTSALQTFIGILLTLFAAAVVLGFIFTMVLGVAPSGG